MSFLAKLFINDEVRNVLNSSQLYSRLVDVNGRPTTKPVGARLELAIESTINDSFFYNQMFSATSKCKGKIVFYKRDGFSTLFKIEFANAHILNLTESFNSTDTMPLHINLSIGWGIMRMRDTLFEESWNPSNPFVAVEETVLKEPEKKITNYFITDIKGNELEKYKTGDTIILNIETENRIGDTMTITLEDKTHDFKYIGQVLQNDTIKDYVIISDLDKIELEVVKQGN